MNAPAEKRMTAAEFLAWCDSREDGRYELFRGEIFATAPERARHVLPYRRVGEAPITLTIVRDGSIPLDPPGIELATSDVFA